MILHTALSANLNILGVSNVLCTASNFNLTHLGYWKAKKVRQYKDKFLFCTAITQARLQFYCRQIEIHINEGILLALNEPFFVGISFQNHYFILFAKRDTKLVLHANFWPFFCHLVLNPFTVYVHFPNWFCLTVYLFSEKLEATPKWNSLRSRPHACKHVYTSTRKQVHDRLSLSSRTADWFDLIIKILICGWSPDLI